MLSAIRNLRGRDVEPSTPGDHSSNVRATSEAGSITDRRQAATVGGGCAYEENPPTAHMGGVCFARERMRRATDANSSTDSFCGCRRADGDDWLQPCRD